MSVLTKRKHAVLESEDGDDMMDEEEERDNRARRSMSNKRRSQSAQRTVGYKAEKSP